MFSVAWLEKNVVFINVFFVVFFFTNARKSTHIAFIMLHQHTFEPHRVKTCLQVFRLGPTQTKLYMHRRWLAAGNFGFRKYRDCTIYVAKTKGLICGFVFAFAKSRFSHDTAHFVFKKMKEARMIDTMKIFSFLCFSHFYCAS